MNTYTIHVDGVAYGGIDYAALDDTPIAGTGREWHSKPMGRDVLLWGGEPYSIGDPISLKSHVDRILARIRDGSLKAKEIVIRVEAQ